MDRSPGDEEFVYVLGRKPVEVVSEVKVQNAVFARVLGQELAPGRPQVRAVLLAYGEVSQDERAGLGLVRGQEIVEQVRQDQRRLLVAFLLRLGHSGGSVESEYPAEDARDTQVGQSVCCAR